MPAKAHNKMLSKQFLLRTKLADHPNKQNETDIPPNFRLMKPTLQTKFDPSIQHLAPDNLNEIEYKSGIKAIHTSSVSEAILAQSDNRVLGTRAPNINPSERTLPRATRCTLSQLRSGHSPFLQEYLHRIKPDLHQDSCPDCGQSPHNTLHLFDCPANPTDLDARILWEDPPAAAEFLGLPHGPGPPDKDE